MVLNYIWIAFFLIAFAVALVRLVFLGDTQVFPEIINSTFSSSKTAFEISLGLTGVLSLWLGIMKIGEKGGVIALFSKLLSPLFCKLFPEIPKGHPVTGSIFMNLAANMLGLDNAATPLGLKAMEGLQELNPKKDTATNPMIMFLVLNTSGLTLIPISIMVYRAQLGAAQPTDIFVPILLATFFSTLAGIITVSIYQKINLLNRTILLFLGGISLLVAGIIYFFNTLSRTQIDIYSTTTAIGVFRASGAMDYLIDGIEGAVKLCGINSDFVGGLPTALMKPLSGSGARGLMVDAMTTYGPDSFVGRLACIFQGSTDTTFYILAVYFGSVGIVKTRHAVPCGLLADLAGVIAAIFICYLFFG